MLRTLLNSKIHRATVTQCDLDYIGSITIDEDLMDAVGIIANEQVQVLDINNGSRIMTYAIKGERGSGVIGINGAAAHLFNEGDLVIICTYVQLNEEELREYNPKVLLVDENNRAARELTEPAMV